MGLASLFAVPAWPVRMNSYSNAPVEPARRLAEPLDQGLGAVHFRQAGFDVAQPGVIRLARHLAQSQLGILQFPK